MEFNYNKLRGRIREKYYTQDKFAKALGIGRVSLSQRLNNSREFSQVEIRKACKILDISEDEIVAYFFTIKVQEVEQNI